LAPDAEEKATADGTNGTGGQVGREFQTAAGEVSRLQHTAAGADENQDEDGYRFHSGPLSLAYHRRG
jgi:hypothetical protein